MRQFNEAEHVREERRKYQKTTQVLTLFILSYIGQWWAWIIFCIWSFFGTPSLTLASILSYLNKIKTIINKNAFQLDVYRPLQWASRGRCVCLGGVCLGVSAKGCLPGGCFPRGYLLRHSPVNRMTDRQV